MMNISKIHIGPHYYTLKHPERNILILIKSRFWNVLWTLFSIPFLGFIAWILIVTDFPNYWVIMKYSFLGLLILFIPKIVRQIKAVYPGTRFIFDRSVNEIFENKQKILVFSEIDHVLAHESLGESDNYSLHLVFPNKRFLTLLDHGGGRKRTEKVGRILSEFCNIRYQFKSD